MKRFYPEKKLSKSIDDDEIFKMHIEFIENKSVLGIDIYKYSEYPENKQIYVPVLFNSLYKITVENCLQLETYFFQKYGNSLNDFKENFISTGDGGFQIFDNPIESIIFANYFQFNVSRFNSGSFISVLNQNLFSIIGKIELRYAITHDKMYSYDNNFFGPAIISNARILAKDNLNRLLTDESTIQWFTVNINTIENLMIIDKDDFHKISYFKDYDIKEKSLLFLSKSKNIKSLDVLKIGTIKSKNTSLEIFNLRIQSSQYVPKLKRDYAKFLVTLGNLNIKGIE